MCQLSLKEKFTYHSLLALFESVQVSLENDIGCNQVPTYRSAMLSDELWRAEATSGIMFHSVHRALAKLKVLWETATYKIAPHLRFCFCLAYPLEIVHLGISTLLSAFQKTISASLHLATRSSTFLVHTFLASFNMTGVPAMDFLVLSTYFRCLWLSLYATGLLNVPHNLKVCFPAHVVTGLLHSRNLQLSARRFFLRLLLLMIVTLILALFLIISSLLGREGLEPHTTPRRFRRMQKNIRYHLRNDL